MPGVTGLSALTGLSAIFGSGVVATYADKVLGYSPIAYWPLWEAAGATAVDQVNSPAQDGAYTGVTLGQPGIGDGNTCPFFDGLNDYVDVYSAAMNAALQPVQELTIAIWVKVFNIGVWTDGSERVAAQFRADANNFAYLNKNNGNNEIRPRYRAGGLSSILTVGGQVTVDWFHYAITASKSANEFMIYIDGAQVGVTQTVPGLWVGALDVARCLIGASKQTPDDVFHGWLAHPALWDMALVPAAIADLATA